MSCAPIHAPTLSGEPPGLAYCSAYVLLGERMRVRRGFWNRYRTPRRSVAPTLGSPSVFVRRQGLSFDVHRHVCGHPDASGHREPGESNRTYEAACSPTATPAATTATRDAAAEMEGFFIMIADGKGGCVNV